MGERLQKKGRGALVVSSHFRWCTAPESAVMRRLKKKKEFLTCAYHLTLISSIDLQETLMNLDVLCKKQMRLLK